MSPPAAPQPIRLGILLFPGFEPLDVVGPLNIFGSVKGIEVLWIAEQPGPVTSVTGSMTVVCSHSVQQMLPSPLAPASTEQQQQQKATEPKLHWLLVPGGLGTRKEVSNPAILSFLQAWCEADTGLQLCMSVCTGAAVLAAAGVLDGKKATSNKSVFEWVASVRSEVQWVRQARWVHDDKFITSSGVTAGADMAVYVLKTQLGPSLAAAAATYNEYVPHTDPEDDPFADSSYVPPV